MRPPTQRGNRAARRHSGRPRSTDPVTSPPGWPDGRTLIDALDVNAVAADVLADVKPETIRTLLTRLDGQTRRETLAAHNIPSAKVSLRAASQVLTILRGEKAPAESSLLRTLCAPAAALFDETPISRTQLTALRLTQPDLAMQLIRSSGGVYRGLYMWHRWGADEHEALALVACIGARYTHAALAASYLAFSRTDVAERYSSLQERFPELPSIAIGTLTTTNAVSRYAKGRPDGRVPPTVDEVQVLLAEDSRVRLAELNWTRRDRERSAQRNVDSTAPVSAPPATPVRPVVFPTGAAPRSSGSSTGEWARAARTAPAVPDVATWANAIASARRIGEDLVGGSAPSLDDLRPLAILSEQMRVLADLLSLVLDRPVAASRAEIDQALTVALADPALTRRLGGYPATGGDAAERLTRLRRTERSAVTQATPRPQTERPEPPPPPTLEPTTAELDLSDLDAMLRGETGAQIAAIAGPKHRAPRPVRAGGGHAENEPDETDEESAESADDTAPDRDGPSDAQRRLLAAACHAVEEAGPLATVFADAVDDLDDAGVVEACAAVPMALLAPATGAGGLIDDDHDVPGPVLRELISHVHEWSQHTVSVGSEAIGRIDERARRVDAIVAHATELLEQAPTRTFKFDKATKVFRHWLAPEGRLHPLLRLISERATADRVQTLIDESRRVGAGRAVDDTAVDGLGFRTKIIAKARQSLIDFHDEVLALADEYVGTLDETERAADADRTAAWLHRRLTDMRALVERGRARLDSEIDALPCPATKAAIGRAITLIDDGPGAGPEPSLDDATTRLFGSGTTS